MKLKKVLAVTLVAAMTMSLAACGSQESTTTDGGATTNGVAEATGTESGASDAGA